MLWASNLNFPESIVQDQPINVTAKIRYKSPESLAILTPHKDWAEVNFERPQRAITSGQAVVFYDKEKVLGGGIIETECPSKNK